MIWLPALSSLHHLLESMFHAHLQTLWVLYQIVLFANIVRLEFLFVVLLSNIRQNCDCCYIRCHSCIMSATASRSEVSSSEVLLPLEDFKSLKIYRVHTGLLQGYLQDRVDSLISCNLMMMMFVVSTWRSPPRNNRARSNASFQALMQSSLSDSQNADTWSKSKPPGIF